MDNFAVEVLAFGAGEVGGESVHTGRYVTKLNLTSAMPRAH